jgi:hypothetical protein
MQRKKRRKKKSCQEKELVRSDASLKWQREKSTEKGNTKYHDGPGGDGHYFRDGAAVVAGDAVGLTSVCQVGDASRASRLGRLRSLRRLIVGNAASKPGIASLVADGSKNAPALNGMTELFVWLVTVLDASCWLPLAV